MTSRAIKAQSAAGLALPAVLLLALLGVVAWQTGILAVPTLSPVSGPETVVIASRPFAYRAAGDFLRGGASIDGPLVDVDDPAPIEIMTYQVSAADYAGCVADGACSRAKPTRRGIGNVPVTGVSFTDATDYALWLSGRTGAHWRLPTVEEWNFAAGSKASDPALGIETDATDPAERWLLLYEREAALDTIGLATPEPLGAFGVNEFGVADLSAVVWEWTASCLNRTSVDAAGSILTFIDSCGVRYLEGRHRTPMNVFTRDAIAGGCSTGRPPDNLGFRLVREPGWLAWLFREARRIGV
jgi:formylglycine-generating enzyme required for sulfatase activity